MAEEGDSQEIRVPVVCKCRPIAQGYVLGNGSTLGRWLPGQLFSPWGVPESSGPVLEPGMAGGGTCREASQGGQRERPERDAKDTILGGGNPTSDLRPLDLPHEKRQLELASRASCSPCGL